MERLAGYENALLANGVDIENLMIEEVPCSDQNLAAPAAKRILSSTPPPTAILAMSDVLAITAMDVARDLGFAIPQDLSVVGYDDVPISSQVQPALTTVHQPLEEKGELAVKLLFNFDGDKERHILPTRLVVRGTTAQPYKRTTA